MSVLDKQEIYFLKGVLTELPEEQRNAILIGCEKIKAILAEVDAIEPNMGAIALGLATEVYLD